MTKNKPTSAIDTSMDLAKYRKAKPETRDEAWTTSINLTQRHRRFLESKNLNFSSLIRDFLDGIMEGAE